MDYSNNNNVTKVFNTIGENNDSSVNNDNKFEVNCKDVVPQPDNSNPIDEECNFRIEEVSLEDLKSIKQDINNRRMPDLSKILPPEHFINKVTTWISGLTDSYYEYSVCGALWILSAVVQGKASLELKQGTYKPNLYLMLLGQSTLSRKSTVVKKSKNVYESATETELYHDEPTVEGYLEMLAQNPVQNFVKDEASGLLAKYHKKYNDGIFDCECEIYDGSDVRKTKASGKNKDPTTITVKNPYVTHFYATTPDKFCSVMTLEDFLCGYGFRFIYAFPTYQKERKDIGLLCNEDVEAWTKVIVSIKKLHNLYKEGLPFEFSITRGALKLFNDISKDLEIAAFVFG
jgi:hypothetical protein